MDKQTILIVDDEASNVEFVSELFEDTSYNIRVAFDGKKALEAVEKFHISLIILDIQMPGIDGYEVAKRLRAKGDDTPIIFLTAVSEPWAIEKAFESGGDDYVSKPFNVVELKARVGNHLKTCTLKHNMKELIHQQEAIIENEIRKNSIKEKKLAQQGRFAAMGEMISMIAHQWRQPLNAVSAANISLKMRHEMGMLEDSFFTEQIDFIQGQIQGMSQTINDFMNFFKSHDKKELFAISRSIDTVSHMMQAQLKSRGIELKVDIDDDLKIEAVKNNLDHVLLNLVANARDAYENSSEQNKQIRIDAHKEKDSITLQVEDDAGGIKDELLEKIFDPYFTTKEDGKGTGIGLNMTKNIIQKHFGGEIEVTNTKTGALFCIKIPLKASV